MEDFILLGMSFPNVFKVFIESYVLYRVVVAVIKHSIAWEGIWHKPLFCLSLYLLSFTLFNFWI